MRKLLLCGMFSLLLAGMSTLSAQSTLRTDVQAPRVSNVEVFDPLTYPAKAIRKGWAGAVKVEVSVDESGKYVSHKVISSPHALLQEAVEPFLPSLQFEPGQAEGKPAAMVKEITFTFSIMRKLPPKTEIDILY
ncbi:MAG: energy transducer TonB [Bacteroidota bacterium]